MTTKLFRGSVAINWSNLFHHIHGGRFCRFGIHWHADVGGEKMCLWCLHSPNRR